MTIIWTQNDILFIFDFILTYHVIIQQSLNRQDIE